MEAIFMAFEGRKTAKEAFKSQGKYHQEYSTPEERPNY